MAVRYEPYTIPPMKKVLSAQHPVREAEPQQARQQQEHPDAGRRARQHDTTRHDDATPSRPSPAVRADSEGCVREASVYTLLGQSSDDPKPTPVVS